MLKDKGWTGGSGVEGLGMDVQAPVLKDKGWTGGLGPSVEGQGMDWGVRPQC